MRFCAKLLKSSKYLEPSRKVCETADGQGQVPRFLGPWLLGGSRERSSPPGTRALNTFLAPFRNIGPPNVATMVRAENSEHFRGRSCQTS